MTHIESKKREDLPGLEPLFEMVEASMGFVPNSMFTMAHWPELLQAFGTLGGTILNTGEVDAGLKQLVAFVSSNASGCRYCQAHTSHSAVKRGVTREKLQAAFDFESSDKFTEAERAALRVALYGGISPNGVEAEHIKLLESHFTAKQIVEIVAVIALFGFLNRWNDTLATTIEDQPLEFAISQLGDNGWTPGKHETDQGETA